MFMSQREAARVWGIPRITVQRAVSDGKLSLTGDKKIDPAEMTRFFGQPRTTAEPAEPSQMRPNEAIDMAVKIGRLEAENEALRDLVKRADAERDRAIETMKLLGHETQNTRRRWWPFR